MSTVLPCGFAYSCVTMKDEFRSICMNIPRQHYSPQTNNVTVAKLNTKVHPRSIFLQVSSVIYIRSVSSQSQKLKRNELFSRPGRRTAAQAANSKISETYGRDARAATNGRKTPKKTATTKFKVSAPQKPAAKRPAKPNPKNIQSKKTTSIAHPATRRMFPVLLRKNSRR
jgi:hypothetical protein